jgi:hypothetical protein
MLGGAAVAGLLVVLLMAAVNALDVAPIPPEPPPPGTTAPEATGRAFSADSWWNTPLPADPPTHPAGTEILEYLSTAPENSDGCLTFSGADGSPWGQPVYWSEPSDPTFDVAPIGRSEFPPELASLRIPEHARAAENSDASMTVYDEQKGYVVALTGAVRDPASGSWSAAAASVAYLESNGLHAATGRSDDPRNQGTHRGNNGATMAVMWHEVRAGAIRHVLKIASGPEVANRAVFPMVGSDGSYEGRDPAVPPQGLRLRIRPSVDLESLDLHEDVLIVARALQRYGVYIGDSGGRTALKLENTVIEGRGQLWNIRSDALCGLPFTEAYWDVLAEGYDPTR